MGNILLSKEQKDKVSDTTMLNSSTKADNIKNKK
jgi:hypothetical protein